MKTQWGMAPPCALKCTNRRSASDAGSARGRRETMTLKSRGSVAQALGLIVGGAVSAACSGTFDTSPNEESDFGVFELTLRESAEEPVLIEVKRRILANDPLAEFTLANGMRLPGRGARTWFTATASVAAALIPVQLWVGSTVRFFN